MDMLSKTERNARLASIEHDIQARQDIIRQLVMERETLLAVDTSVNVLELLQCLDNCGCLKIDKKVNLIKGVREATGLGLKEAKYIVDTLYK